MIDKKIARFMSVLGTRQPEELTYRTGDGKLMFINGFAAVIVEDDPTVEARGTQNYGIPQMIAEATTLIEIPTLQELKKEIKRRKAKRKDRPLIELCEYGFINAFYLMDVLSIIGDGKAYWKGHLDSSKTDNRCRWISSIYIKGDKGEGIILGVKTESPHVVVEYPAEPIYNQGIDKYLDRIPRHQMATHKGKLYIVQAHYIVVIEDKLHDEHIQESDKWLHIVNIPSTPLEATPTKTEGRMILTPEIHIGSKDFDTVKKLIGFDHFEQTDKQYVKVIGTRGGAIMQTIKVN